MERHDNHTKDIGWFQAVFLTAHCKLQETTHLTVQYLGMHPVNMVCDVVVGLQEVSSPIDTPATVTEPHKHVANAVQSMQHQLEAQMHQMQTVNQAIQLKYANAPQPTYQDYGCHGKYGGGGLSR